MLKQRTFLKPFALVVYAFFVGHWSGMTPLQTFAVHIFTTVGTPINKYYATVLIGELPPRRDPGPGDAEERLSSLCPECAPCGCPQGWWS